MKKKIPLFLFVPLLFAPLIGCSNKKGTLTYGTYLTTSISELENLSSTELKSKLNDFGETLILATYQKEASESCLCWSTFKNVIVNFVNTYHEKVYTYDMDNYDENTGIKGLEKYDDSTPALYVYKGEQQLAKFTYRSGRDKNIFSDLKAEAMYKRIHDVVNKPVIYEVDDNFLNENLNQKDKSVVMFIRNSCPDCSYSLTNVIIPYINSNQINNEIWYFDLDQYYKLSKDNNASEDEKAQYQKIKDKYGLSENGNMVYGYSTGFVPTTQYYESGVLKDASVFFNDKVSKNEDGFYYISDSFYTEERLTSLSYAKNVKNNVLKGLSVNDEVLTLEDGSFYWLQEKAAQYHTPLLNAFLDYYCK